MPSNRYYHPLKPTVKRLSRPGMSPCIISILSKPPCSVEINAGTRVRCMSSLSILSRTGAEFGFMKSDMDNRTRVQELSGNIKLKRDIL